MQHKYPPPKVIAVDVDDTLLLKSGVNQQVVQWCKDVKNNGFSLILWSSRGESHARRAAQAAGIEHLFDHILSKPGYILDDQGWSWVKYTQVMRLISPGA